MSYRVKEIFYTLQGEGANAGRPAVFLRFAGCNLWSGHEEHRAKAICQFCDTDFVGTDGTGGGVYEDPDALAAAVRALWPVHLDVRSPFVVCTGGEPLLQLDDKLIEALDSEGCVIAVETNGTIVPPRWIDWLCVSPKAGTDIVVTKANELKLVFPQPGLDPAVFAARDYYRLYLQPMDGPNLAENTKLAVEYCLAHPQWRLSLQTHKILGLR